MYIYIYVYIYIYTQNMYICLCIHTYHVGICNSRQFANCQAPEEVFEQTAECGGACESWGTQKWRHWEHEASRVKNGYLEFLDLMVWWTQEIVDRLKRSGMHFCGEELRPNQRIQMQKILFAGIPVVDHQDNLRRYPPKVYHFQILNTNPMNIPNKHLITISFCRCVT